MKFNKSPVTLLLSAVLLTSALSAHAANDGTIDFTGELIASTCTVEGLEPGGNTVSKLVDLQQVPVSILATGSESSSTGKYFSIKVGGTGDTGCTDGLKAAVRFDPSSPAIDAATGNLKIDSGTDAATNVQVRVFNQGETTPINLLTSNSKPVEIDNNTAELPFVAEYYSAAGNATAGKANTRVGFQVVYE